MLWSNTLKCYDWLIVDLANTYFVYIDISKWSVYRLSLIILPNQHRQRVLYLAGKIIQNNKQQSDNRMALSCTSHRFVQISVYTIIETRNHLLKLLTWKKWNNIALLAYHCPESFCYSMAKLVLLLDSISFLDKYISIHKKVTCIQLTT